MVYTPNLRTQSNSYIPLYYFIVTATEADGGRVHYTASRFQVLLKWSEVLLSPRSWQSIISVTGPSSIKEKEIKNKLENYNYL